MSVLSTVELLCYFESLRNVDLFEQGFYSVRAKIYTEKNNITAIPLTHYNTSSPARKIDNPRHNLFQAQISPAGNTYSTKTFWVQYTEEVIDINEAVHFRIDVPDLESQNILLEVELLFSPEESPNGTDQLKPVSQQKFRMKSLQQGMNQFYPIIFDEWHFAVVRFAVHACLLDFIFKPSLTSFLRFPGFSSSPSNNEQDRIDTSLFGLPCRKLLKDSYTKLSKNFQKLCVHVPAKQRTILGSDYFVVPPLSLAPSLLSSITTSKNSSAPNTPTTRIRSFTTSELPNSKLIPVINQLPMDEKPSLPLLSRPSRSGTAPPLFLDLHKINKISINEATSTDKNENIDESSDDDNNATTATNFTSATATTATSTSTTSSTSSTTTRTTTAATVSTTTIDSTTSTSSAADPDKVNPPKAALILDNARDQYGIGSPRQAYSSFPTSPTSPPLFSLSDSSEIHPLITRNPPTSPPLPPLSLSDSSETTVQMAVNPHTTPHIPPVPSTGLPLASPRLGASTGNRPSYNRNCASATLDFFSRSNSSTTSSASTINNSQSLSSAPPVTENTATSNYGILSKGNSLSSVVVAGDVRNTRKNRQRPLTFTTRPLSGPVPQDIRTKAIMTEIHSMGDQIFALWIRFTKVFHLVGKENTFRVAQKFEQKFLQLFKDSVFREVAHVSSLDQMLELQANPQRHRQMAQSVRNSEYYKKLKTSRFEQIILRPELSGQPIILEQVIDSSHYAAPEEIIHLLEDNGTTTTTSPSTTTLSTEPLSPFIPPTPPTPPPILSPVLSPAVSPTVSPTPPPNRRLEKQHSYVNNPPKAFSGSHLYIMVHGLAGNPWDLRMFRNQIALNFPESEFLICSCVEQNTLGDIEEMGNNVAKEISEYMQQSALRIGKISFVGHSLGGVIIRAALCDPLLAPYLSKLYTFVSLSVPHIGTLYPYSSLIPGAMWVWQKWSNSACLLQLRLIDHPDPTKTYLYKLSQTKGLEYFQNILLVSSEQDLYVPFHSARIEVCQEAQEESRREEKKGSAKLTSSSMVEMVKNVWEGVLEGWRSRGRFGEIVRYDLVFESHRGMDGMIGRSAHIRLLDSPKVMHMLITTNASLFK